MSQTTKPKVWPTDRPFVVYMIPPERSADYAIVMDALATGAVEDLKMDPEGIEMVGLIANTPRHGTEGLYFLGDMGIEPRRVTLLVLWGETAECVNFQEIPEECGLGTVILVEPGVVIPTVRMPSLVGDWWEDPIHLEYASIVLTNLIRNGRDELTGEEPFVLVGNRNSWN